MVGNLIVCISQTRALRLREVNFPVPGLRSRKGGIMI